jgi:hypothetical protein
VQELANGRALGFDLPDPTTHSWIRVARPASIAILPAVSDLGEGEREALALAAEMPGTILIIDDGLARRHAEILRLKLTGTVRPRERARGSGRSSAAQSRAAASRWQLLWRKVQVTKPSARQWHSSQPSADEKYTSVG